MDITNTTGAHDNKDIIMSTISDPRCSVCFEKYVKT